MSISLQVPIGQKRSSFPLVKQAIIHTIEKIIFPYVCLSAPKLPLPYNTLPYPQEVIQVAQQIDQEYKAGRYDSWFVTARDGVLSVMPLPHGYYVFNVKEFTKHFDGVLNVLYGSDTLTQGRHFLNQAK